MFRATIDAYLLRDSVEILSVLVDEIRLKTSSDGISVKAVDPANVAMVTFKLDSSAFDDFEGDEGEIGLDLTKISDILGVADKNDKVSMELNRQFDVLKES